MSRWAISPHVPSHDAITVTHIHSTHTLGGRGTPLVRNPHQLQRVTSRACMIMLTYRLDAWGRSRCVRLACAALFGNQRLCVGMRRKYPGTTIVTDSVTSNGLTSFITEQVCPAVPFEVGK